MVRQIKKIPYISICDFQPFLIHILYLLHYP